MSDDAQFEREVEKGIRGFRRLGWAFVIVGTPAAAYLIVAAFDPSASIRVEGVETRAYGTKIGVAAYALIFPIAGALLALTPKEKLAPLFRRSMRRAFEMLSKVGHKD